MIIISTSLTVPGRPSPQFYVEARLPFRNREIGCLSLSMQFVSRICCFQLTEPNTNFTVTRKSPGSHSN